MATKLYRGGVPNPDQVREALDGTIHLTGIDPDDLAADGHQPVTISKNTLGHLLVLRWAAAAGLAPGPAAGQTPSGASE